MNTKTKSRDLIADLFEEEAFVIGGLIATHEMSDDLIWSLVRSLDVIRQRALDRLGEEEVDGEHQQRTRRADDLPHPAVGEFLQRIHEDIS